MPRRADKKSESPRRSKPGKAAAAKGRTTAARKKGDGAATESRARGLVKQVVTSVIGALKRRAGKRTAAKDTKTGESRKSKPATKAARAPRREADIPMDQIAETYTPTQTSLKGPFRASGADHQRDQEFAGGRGDERWKDEDLLTNKSGDPRIGTHGRTYEPGEKRTASGSDEE